MDDHQFGYITKLAKRTWTCHAIRATLDEGPRSNEIEQYYWLRAINWIHGLYLRVQDQKSGKIKAKPTWHHFGGKINWFRPKEGRKKKTQAQKRAHDLENQDAR